jgi:hypothetical protein
MRSFKKCVLLLSVADRLAFVCTLFPAFERICIATRASVVAGVNSKVCA